ncbi:MAG: hypothetical protein L0H19_06025, partial [Salinisphaera sp.]|nr:hypothetical protein [Salinisphaera sp.]
MIFVAAALEIGLLVGLMRLRRWLAQSRARLARIQARLAEAGRCAEARAQARARGERITGAVEAGTASLEALHRAIADLSFELSGDTR